MPKTVVFIDGGCLTKILKDFKRPQIDYMELVKTVAEVQDIIRIYYYDCLPYCGESPTVIEKQRYDRKQQFLSKLSELPRFSIKIGKLEFRGIKPNGEGDIKQKRVDTQMATDIAAIIGKRGNEISTIVFITGDSDFIPSVEFAQQEGLIVRLVHGPKGSYHEDLWKQADERIEITPELLLGTLLDKRTALYRVAGS